MINSKQFPELERLNPKSACVRPPVPSPESQIWLLRKSTILGGLSCLAWCLAAFSCVVNLPEQRPLWHACYSSPSGAWSWYELEPHMQEKRKKKKKHPLSFAFNWNWWQNNAPCHLGFLHMGERTERVEYKPSPLFSGSLLWGLHIRLLLKEKRKRKATLYNSATSLLQENLSIDEVGAEEATEGRVRKEKRP